MVFILVGFKPLVVKNFSGYKKKNIKFVLTVTRKNFISLLKTFSLFILSKQEKKKKLVLKKETFGFFFIFNKTYLEYLETFNFYNFLTIVDLSFLFEHLTLIFKFKYDCKLKLKLFLNSFQIPV